MRTRGLIASGLVILVALAALTPGCAVAPLLYGVHAPSPHFSAPRSAAEAQRDDLNYLRNITTADWSYTERTRAEADAVIDAAIAGPLPLSPGRFELVVRRVLAIADNGHTNIGGGERANRFNRLPIRFYAFADGIFVVRALPQAEPLLGARLLAVDGAPVETVRARLGIYVGGTDGEKNARLPFLLESPELLNAAGLAQSPDQVVLTVRTREGLDREVVLRALPPDPNAPKLWPSAEIKPQPNVREDPAWRAALSGQADSMLMFADAPKPFLARALNAEKAFYVRFDTNADQDGFRIADFASSTMAALLAARPRTVIIDVRMNGGGDYTTTASFMRSLPRKLPAARIYVLMSQETFSAGMSSVAFLKQAGGDRVILVGDWPGDRIRFHSEGGQLCLPNSRICMPARTAIHDYSTTSCRPWRECYLLDRVYPAKIASFEPQILAPLTFAALSHGQDPALEAVFPAATAP